VSLLNYIRAVSCPVAPNPGDASDNNQLIKCIEYRPVESHRLRHHPVMHGRLIVTNFCYQLEHPSIVVIDVSSIQMIVLLSSVEHESKNVVGSGKTPLSHSRRAGIGASLQQTCIRCIVSLKVKGSEIYIGLPPLTGKQ